MRDASDGSAPFMGDQKLFDKREEQLKKRCVPREVEVRTAGAAHTGAAARGGEVAINRAPIHFSRPLSRPLSRNRVHNSTARASVQLPPVLMRGARSRARSRACSVNHRREARLRDADRWEEGRLRASGMVTMLGAEDDDDDQVCIPRVGNLRPDLSRTQSPPRSPHAGVSARVVFAHLSQSPMTLAHPLFVWRDDDGHRSCGRTW